MSGADIRGMFAGMPGAHGIIEAALNGQWRVMTDDAAHPSSAAVLAGDFLFFGGEPSEELVRRALNGHFAGAAAGRDARADWRGGNGVLPQKFVGGGLRESIHGG